MLRYSASALMVAFLCFAPSAFAQTTLEIPSRVAVTPAPQPEETASPDQSNQAEQPDTGTSGQEVDRPLPYLGASIQYIESDEVPGKQVRGLEIVSVDPNSPAEQAGLHGRGSLTKIGATGATAGALMPPLDLIVMPLLKKAGKLGDDGDLIIAIDDNRVNSENDLRTVLESLKPGDTIYFTIVRQHQDSHHETLKIPVKLGANSAQAANGSTGQ
jgi:S1-C subfamily serine protease